MDSEDVNMDVTESISTISKGKSRDLATLDLDEKMWTEKYRPQSLEDVVSHQDTISTIDQFIAKNRFPHLLFYGPPGTGKTSTILAVARKIYGANSAALRNNCLELNASDDRGIDVVREQIKNFASTKMIYSSGFKLIILDEADQMTTAAQSALRRVIEQYTKNVRFCIICNYVNKIIPAVQSRCTRFRFGPLPKIEVEKRLSFVVDAEKVNLTADGRQALLKLSRGDMRRALNILQACHAAYDVTDESAIYNCTGNPHPSDIEDIMKSMMNDTFETSYQRVSDLKADKGLALQDVITGIYDYVATVEFSPQTRVYILDQLAQVEHRLSTGGSEKLQLTALLGATKVARTISPNSSRPGSIKSNSATGSNYGSNYSSPIKGLRDKFSGLGSSNGSRPSRIPTPKLLGAEIKSRFSDEEIQGERVDIKSSSGGNRFMDRFKGLKRAGSDENGNGEKGNLSDRVREKSLEYILPPTVPHDSLSSPTSTTFPEYGSPSPRRTRILSNELNMRGLEPFRSRNLTSPKSSSRVSQISSTPLSDLDDFGSSILPPLPPKDINPINLPPEARPFSPATINHSPPLRSVSSNLSKQLELSRSTSSKSSISSLKRSKDRDSDVFGKNTSISERKVQLRKSIEKLITTKSSWQEESTQFPKLETSLLNSNSLESIPRSESNNFTRMISEPDSTPLPVSPSSVKKDTVLPKVPIIPAEYASSNYVGNSPVRKRQISSKSVDNSLEGAQSSSSQPFTSFINLKSTNDSIVVPSQPLNFALPPTEDPFVHSRIESSQSVLVDNHHSTQHSQPEIGLNGSRLVESGLLNDSQSSTPVPSYSQLYNKTGAAKLNAVDLKKEIARIEAEMALNGASPTKRSNEESTEMNGNHDASSESKENDPRSRWSIVELEMAYSRMKGMLLDPSLNSDGTSDAVIGDVEGEKSFEKSLLSSGLQPTFGSTDSTSIPTPTAILKVLPDQDSAVASAKLLVLPATVSRSRELSNDTFIGSQKLRSESNSSSDFNNGNISSPATSAVPTLLSTKPSREFMASPSNDVFSVEGGIKLVRSRTNETTSDDGWASARSVITTRTNSRNSSNVNHSNLPLRSGAGREWIRESQRLWPGDEVEQELSTASLASLNVGEMKRDGTEGSSDTWYSPNTSPIAKRMNSVPATVKREGKPDSNITMASVRMMDKLEIYLLLSGMRFNLEKSELDRKCAEMEREAIMEELLESRSIAESFKRSAGPDRRNYLNQLEEMTHSRNVWESRAKKALLDLEASREFGDSSLRRGIEREEEWEKKKTQEWISESAIPETPPPPRRQLRKRVSSLRIRGGNISPTRTRENKSSPRFTGSEPAISRSKFSSRSTLNRTNMPKFVRPIVHVRKSSTFSNNSITSNVTEYNDAILRVENEPWAGVDLGAMPKLTETDEILLRHLDGF